MLLFTINKLYRSYRKVLILIVVNIILISLYLWIFNIGRSNRSYSNYENIIESSIAKNVQEKNEHEFTGENLPYERSSIVKAKDIRNIENNKKEFVNDNERVDEMFTLPQHKHNIPSKYDYSKRDLYKVPEIEHQMAVSCEKLFEKDTNEIKKAEELHDQRPGKVPISEETYIYWLRNCHGFKLGRGYINVATEQEENWPLAFSIAVYRDIEQAERLLRSVWRPHNFYCFHIDRKAPYLYHQAVRAIAKCFDNVFIASHLDKIKWGDVSILLPAVNCMRDFVAYYRGRWKYFINLTGQEFPLRTNYELARIAEIFNGSNDIGGSLSRMAKDMERVQHVWSHRWSRTYQQMIFYDTLFPKSHFTFDGKKVMFIKGELHGFFSHNFVQFIVQSRVANEYLKWCWDSGHPSEHYWNVLNYNQFLNAPGGYIGNFNLSDTYSYNLAIRLKQWNSGYFYGGRPCAGRYLRGICNYGLHDVIWMINRPEMFANKFNLTYQWYGYECLEEWHRNKTKLMDKINFDETYYRSLPTVKYSRKNGLGK